MNSIKLNLVILLFFCAGTLAAQEPDTATAGLFKQDELKLIASDFSFTEGCSPNQQGDVFFTDQPNDKIWKYSREGLLSVFLDQSGRANGTYFDSKGNLVVCADAKGELWAINPSGKIKVLLADFEGKQLNGPNDLWINAKGGIYFTDPLYKRDYWTRTATDLSSNDVYYLPKGVKQARRVAAGMVRPNGIVGTPDGKYLYIADIGANKTYRYSIEKNGDLAGKKLMMEYGSDGMTLDEKGNIYLTTGAGVLIFNAKGQKIAAIKLPHQPSNLCFSGKDKNVLFITARQAIYSLAMNVKGIE
ncbi:gluconolactonase [Pedobacter sp. PACM 27299]|uniref:SMP-30/gluconolactonase/LRE family protein n=1 Tax=Pedobacter sp. PACM 27299 TaxID=1727164 RepID=UPI0007064CE7|nr:SMP-30/gluconolactonase/LRE family protein [Pedobacter sp. PACM 27299]ALL06736.1 gluconolactonase [Pedobacter sp. PACM 27299]